MWRWRRPSVALEKATCGTGEGHMWCWRRPDVVLEKATCGAGEGQINFDRSCEKCSVTESREGEECHIYSKQKERLLTGLVTSCVGTAF